MNNNIKISATILGIPGRVRQYAGVKKVPIVSAIDKKTDKKRFVKIKDWDWPTVQKHINLTQDAYDAFISNEVPSWFHGKWKKLNKTQRIEEHLKRIVIHNNGTSFVYNILDD